MKALKKRVGDLLRRARVKNGIRTQSELAEKLGVEPATVSRWESGIYSPDPKSLEKIIEVLGVSEEYFSEASPPLSPTLQSLTKIIEEQEKKIGVLEVQLAKAHQIQKTDFTKPISEMNRRDYLTTLIHHISDSLVEDLIKSLEPLVEKQTKARSKKAVSGDD